jgi:murein DD-endopeptidase MepM/ murein hydrolase activator NlpD
MRFFLAVMLVPVLGGSSVAAAPLGAGLPVVHAAAGVTPQPQVHYRYPLPGQAHLLNTFMPPAQRYGPGHLGVDLAATRGTVVYAAGAGTVRFAGTVAGRGIVVILHTDGITTEYEPVSSSVRAGAQLSAGQPLGQLQSVIHPSCAPFGCLHWGAKRGPVYLDPLSLLQRLGVVRLIPSAEIGAGPDR